MNVYQMKNQIQILIFKILSILLLEIPIALADDNNNNIIDETLRPNLQTGLMGLPPEIRTLLTWAISTAFVFGIAYKIVQIIKEASLSEIAKKRHKTIERAEHVENILHHAIMLIVMIVTILLIIFVASRP